MNVLLIHPYITIREPNVDLNEPLGLVSLATYLRDVLGDTVRVEILDLYQLGEDKPRSIGDGQYILGLKDRSVIEQTFSRFQPDLVGIACNFTAYAQDALEVASAVKDVAPHTPIVMGGAHATMDSKGLLEEHSCVDFVVRNEGEITLRELVTAIDEGLPLSSIDGLSYRDTDNKVLENPNRKFISDIDVLPIPDRSFINMHQYMRFRRRTTWYTRKRPIASIITSRGCPFDCVFCSTKVMWRRKWRPRSVAKVTEEIEILASDYGAREITIFDDQFFTDRKRVEKFCEYFAARKPKLAFSYDAGTSPWLVDEALLKQMKKAGFYALRFPIETGNPQTLKFIKKPVNLAKARDIVRSANRLGYWTSGNFILGFPYETREEMEETIQYAYGCGLDFASFIAARPHRGSELYDIFEKEGLLDSGVIHTSVFDVSDYDSTQMSAEEITGMITRAAKGWYAQKLKFYLHPLNFVMYFLPKFKSLGDVLYGFRMCLRILSVKIVPLLRKT
jgi:radical SAM superfamily enzyme YgiQ (UPF0313 family)